MSQEDARRLARRRLLRRAARDRAEGELAAADRVRGEALAALERATRARDAAAHAVADEPLPRERLLAGHLRAEVSLSLERRAALREHEARVLESAALVAEAERAHQARVLALGVEERHLQSTEEEAETHARALASAHEERALEEAAELLVARRQP